MINIKNIKNIKNSINIKMKSEQDIINTITNPQKDNTNIYGHVNGKYIILPIKTIENIAGKNIIVKHNNPTPHYPYQYKWFQLDNGTYNIHYIKKEWVEKIIKENDNE